MTHTFKLITNNEPAVLERLLRVTRHRGFTLQMMKVTASDDQLAINFTVDSLRPVNRLFNQLEKLYDVKTIEILE